MSSSQIANLLTTILIIMVCILVGLAFIWILLKIKSNKIEKQGMAKHGEEQSKKKTKIQESYNIQSIFDFMEFDKIEDNMIIQKKGIKYLMIIKCQGINYDLMSGVEKTSVEQGFTQYLNTLRYPIQIYVQTRTVDLTGSINTYKEKVKNIGTELARREFEYNQKVRSEKYDNKTLEREHFEIVKSRNLYEYGMDIVGNTERMSLNRNILSKQYYIILSYYPDETGNYSQEEIKNMAFSELYTRCQSTISLLSVCGINSKILDSIELADLLYTAYNRDEAETYDLAKAINAGYDNIYTTAPDVLEKRMKELDKQIEIDALEKANEAIFKVKSEQEKEKKLRQKEKNYDTLVADMAKAILESNKDILGDEVAKRAEEKISTPQSKRVGGRSKEDLENEPKTTKKSGRTRKTA